MSKYPELTSLNRGYNDDSGMVYKYRNGNIQYEGLLDGGTPRYKIHT